MREKLKRTLRGEPRLLRLSGEGRERLDYSRAEWLASGPSPLLLPFKYCREGNGFEFDYDLVGMVPLPSFLGVGLSARQYASLLGDVRDVVSLCVAEGLSTSLVRFAPEGVFADAEGSLRFVLVPASGLHSQHGLPLDLLRWLGDSGHVRMTVPGDVRHVTAVGDWAERRGVLSPEELSAFLDDEFAARPRRAGSSPVVAPSAGRSETSASATLDPLSLLGLGAVAPKPVAERVSSDLAFVGEVPQAPVATPGGTTSSLGVDPTGGAMHEHPETVRLPRVERVRDGLSIEVPQAGATIGRSSASGMHFGGNSNISRSHARVEPDGDGIVLSDLGSANGTFVAGRRLPAGGRARVPRDGGFLLADEAFRVA